MFKVKLETASFDRMYFKFETLELAQNFVSTVMESVDVKDTKGIKATIEYFSTYQKKDKEEGKNNV